MNVIDMPEPLSARLGSPTDGTAISLCCEKFEELFLRKSVLIANLVPALALSVGRVLHVRALIGPLVCPVGLKAFAASLLAAELVLLVLRVGPVLCHLGQFIG